MLAHDCACVVQNGDTALIVAARYGHPTIVGLLIAVKAPLNAQTLRGSTALYIASDRGHTECVRALLKSGADANVTDKVTVFHCCHQS